MTAHDDTLFEQLLSAKSEEEELRLVLSRLPDHEREAVWVAAVPHWFDGAALAALLKTPPEEGRRLYAALQSLPFVSPYQGRGSCIHELTRSTLLRLWWTSRRKQFREVSGRAAAYFGAQADERSLVEAASHSLVSGELDAPALAAKWNEVAARLRSLGQFVLIHPLVQGLREHIAGGRIPAQTTEAMREWERRTAEDLMAWAEHTKQDVEVNDPAEALSQARAIYADLGDRLGEASVLLRLGRTYRERGEWEKAKRELERGLEGLISAGDSAKAADTCAELGDISLAMGENDEALGYFDRGLTISDTSTECRLGRTDVLRILGRHADALEEVNRVLATSPQNWRALANYGEIARLQGAYSEAVEKLSTVVALNPNYAWALGSRGEAYRQLSRFEDAIADFTRAVELEPSFSWALGSRGQAYRQLGRFDEAIADLTRAVELDPSYSWAFGERGEAYRQLGRYDEAIADLTRAVELDPSYSWAFRSRGEAYRQLGRFDEATADLKRAVELDPKFS